MVVVIVGVVINGGDREYRMHEGQLPLGAGDDVLVVVVVVIVVPHCGGDTGVWCRCCGVNVVA